MSSVVIAGLALLNVAAPLRDLPLRIGGDDSATLVWTQQFATSNDDWVNDLVPLGNGNVLAVGFLNRANGPSPSDWHSLAAQVSPEGRLVTQQTYGAGRGIDAFWSVAEANGGARMFAGFTTRMGGGGIDGLALLSAPDGELRAERAFGGPGYDRFTDLAVASDGYVFLGHSQAEGSEKRRIFIVKTDVEGRPMWEHIHDAPESWGALYIEPLEDGFLIAGGTTVGGDRDMFAMKVDTDGREVWRKRAGTPGWDEVNHGLVVRPDGTIVLIGYAHRRGEETNDLVAAILTSSGEVRSIETFGGSGDDRAILAKADSDGRIWIVGQTASSGAGGTDLLLARLDRNGRFERAALTVGGKSDDNGTALLPLADGSLLLAGYSRGLGHGSQDAFIARIRKPAFDRTHPSFRTELIQP